ncbi:unnamed protein product [Rhodiola kirilowii]
MNSSSSQDICIPQSNSVIPEAVSMQGSRYNYTPGTPRTRLERLIRDRELRRLNRSGSVEDISNGANREDDFSPFSNYGDNSSYFREDGVMDGVAVEEAERELRPKQRLLVVANRLPVSAVRKGEESWQLEVSVGGLVSALLGVKDFEARWIGWAGVNVPDEAGQRALSRALAEKRCIPVFLDEETVHQYYNGYCNNILWPLFHYLGLPQEDRLATTRSFQSQFDAYKKANKMFADVVTRFYQEGDVVWCHDYHLMFLPKYLKESNSDIKVGWFLHTPFPSSEIHRTLPSRSELLRSVLAADLVGFHTYDYARHFVSACTRILGLEGTPEGVEDHGKLTRVAAFPIGIDAERFTRALELPQVQEHMKELKERFAGRKLMLGVDRLDMIKGIPQKLLAFEEFLEKNPRWHDKVILVQIAVPTRTDVPEYQKLTSEVHEIVGRINGRFGTLTAVPIHHLDRSLDFYALCALYAVTDVVLVTSLRDGMNLVSYEFVICQDEKKGVLILSEFAGAAQSLGAGAILVNPWNITEVASSICYALEMPAEEREKRHNHNFNHVTSHTSQEWAETFISELNDTIVEAQLQTKQVPPSLPVELALDRYSRAANRLIILGFNATLTEPVANPGRRGDQIREMEPKLHPDLKEPLKKLCADPTTTVLILSGSTRSVLDDNFGEFDMYLAAENGMFLRSTNGEWMTTMPENLNMDWVDSVKHVFEYFTERTPRSHFELRETSIVWNYKYADVEFGRIQAIAMLQHLWTGPISNASLDVVQGSRSVEVRAVGVTKGAAIDRILGEIVHQKMMREPIDYVLCVGHFIGKDEDIYTFFEPELPSDPALADHVQPNTIGSSPLSNGSVCRTSRTKTHRPLSSFEKRAGNHHHHTPLTTWQPTAYERLLLHEGSSVLDLKGENYFSCAVGRKLSQARYLLGSTDEVVALLKQLAVSGEPGQAS